MNNEKEYQYWMVWGTTYEGDKRWFMVRTSDLWDADMVKTKAQNNASEGGVGGDMATITEVETGYDDGIWTEYEDYI